MVPSDLAPSFIFMFEPGVGPEPSKVSFRLITTLTGVPVFLDRIAATGSTYIGILPPKPPPISVGVTRICDTGISRRSAKLSLTTKDPWVLHHT